MCIDSEMARSIILAFSGSGVFCFYSSCEEHWRHFTSNLLLRGHSVELGVGAGEQGVDFHETAGENVENILLECSDFVFSRLLYKEGEGKENSLKFECRRIHNGVDLDRF